MKNSFGLTVDAADFGRRGPRKARFCRFSRARPARRWELQVRLRGSHLC